MTRWLLPAALAGLVVGCSLLVQPDPASQCTIDAECTGTLGGRVCREGFCVLASDPDAAPDSSPGAPPEGGADGSRDVEAGEPDLLTPQPGDQVLLLPETVEVEGTTVTAWRNAVPGTTLRRAVSQDIVGAGRPGLRELRGHNCVELQTYQRLVMTDDAGGAFAAPADFSVSAVVRAVDETMGNAGGTIPVGRFTTTSDSEGFQAIGWGLRTAWQAGDGKATFNRFGVSLNTVAGLRSPTNVVEVIDPSPHDTELHVLALTVRIGGAPTLRLWVDGVPRAAPKSFVTTQPSTANLTLGSVLGPPYQWTAFAGDLCAVLVHHGAETDGAFAARQGALKTRFAIP